MSNTLLSEREKKELQQLQIGLEATINKLKKKKEKLKKRKS